MTDTTINPAEAGPEAQIDSWLAEATPDAADRLEALATSTGSKEVRKAARRALYLLSLKGVAPQARPNPAQSIRTNEDRVELLRVWASAYDGAGNRLFILVLTPPDGGDATVAQLLANDELGIRDLSLEKRRMREVEALMERLGERIDGGLAIAEIEPDYARALLDRFRKLNIERRKTTPAGFVDLVPRIGASTHAEQEPPVYAAMAAESDGAAAPADPADLFKLSWFEPWFFAVEEVAPWLQSWMDAEGSEIVVSEKAKQERKEKIVSEAAVAVFTDRLRGLYVARLEESADVLRRRGRMTEARQALRHAQELKSDRPIEEVPFARAIATRTLEAGAEIVAAQRAQAEGAGTAGE